MAEHGTGNRPPQVLTLGTTRVTVAFGAALHDGGVAQAGMSISVPSEPGQPSRPYATYAAGQSVTLSSVHVRVLAVYDEPGQSHDAVDLEITTG